MERVSLYFFIIVLDLLPLVYRRHDFLGGGGGGGGGVVGPRDRFERGGVEVIGGKINFPKRSWFSK